MAHPGSIYGNHIEAIPSFRKTEDSSSFMHLENFIKERQSLNALPFSKNELNDWRIRLPSYGVFCASRVENKLIGHLFSKS
jgi:hypothetical protein